MNKKEEFKRFIKDKEFLIDKVNKGETSWQKLYEIYDLYGENASIFKEEVKEETRENKTNNLLKAFEDIDVNKINENLEGVRKILAVLGEFTRKDDTKVKRSYNKPSSNYDD
ncbi:MAG: hypothetical protein IKJ30_01255 [Bacilli bacterium]|nr:hypothetical protein [Bacilli bacterium]